MSSDLSLREALQLVAAKNVQLAWDEVNRQEQGQQARVMYPYHDLNEAIARAQRVSRGAFDLYQRS